ncbi:MAG: DsbA family protein, partial [Myxococcales bacterium]|nr:DsbA family protein [Myxococcales bacterium]
DISDSKVVAAVCRECGFDGDMLVAAAERDDIKAALRQSTDDAVAAGVFGAPAFVVHGEGEPQLFWGSDRFELALRAASGLS